MTTIRQQRLPIPAAQMNGESTLPLLYDIRLPGEASDSDLSENDGLFLGCAWLAEGDAERAEEALNTSCTLEANTWNTYAMAELYRVLGQQERAASTMLGAFHMAPEDDNLCKRTAKELTAAGLWDMLAAFTDALMPHQKQLPRIRLYLAVCAQKRGQLELAEQILTENGGLEFPDIQEGEVSITELWFDIAQKKAERDGVPFDRSTARPPKKFDFRMNVSK